MTTSTPTPEVSGRDRNPFLARTKLADKLGERGLRICTFLAALLAVALVVWIVCKLVHSAWPAIDRFGLAFVVHRVWDPVTGQFGALPFLYGTALSSLLALLVATPVAIAIAIYLTELAPSFLRKPVAMLVELLAAIPSVILGLWGILVLGPFLGNHLEPFLKSFLGWLPLFSGTPSPYGMLNASIILTIMVLPIITSVTREVFQTTPVADKEGALALGATRWEMIKLVVLPQARPGLVGAVMLGLGRAIGEAIAVTQVIGNAAQIKASLFASGGTAAAQIASDFPSANPGVWQASLIYLAVILLVFSALANIAARLIVRHGTVR
jgi:phosphate transport system permease protein